MKILSFLFATFFILSSQYANAQDDLTFRNDTKQKMFEEALPKFKAKMDSTVKIAMIYKGYTLKYIANIKVLTGNINCKETFAEICLDKICDDFDSLKISDTDFNISLKELVTDGDGIKSFAQLYLFSEFINSQVYEVAAAASICYWEKLYEIDVKDRINKFYWSDEWNKKEEAIISELESQN